MATAGTQAATGSGFGSWVRVHWSAVIAGALFALGVHIVMGLIGAALGLAAAPADSKGLGVGAAIWALITPFVATLCGAWLAIRLSGEREDMSGYVHGILVWSIGLIAGALFLTGTAATSAMTAGTAASGNAGPAQRAARQATGQSAPSRGDAERGAEQAGTGLLGAVVATGLANRARGGGAGQRRGLGWRIAIQRRDRRREGAQAGDAGRYGETYRPTTPGPYGEGRGGELPRDEGTTDPYHH